MNPGGLLTKESAVFPIGGGDTGRRIREFDWRNTPLGETHYWPAALKTSTQIILASLQPMFICWGKDALTTIFNDPCALLLGKKQAVDLGKPAPEIWKAVFDNGKAEIAALFNDATLSGTTLLFPSDQTEQPWLGFSISPIIDADGTVQGLFGTYVENSLRKQAAVTSKPVLKNAFGNVYSLLNEVPFAVALVTGKTLAIEFINNYALDIWALSREGVAGKPLFDIFPANKAGFESLHEQVYQSGRRVTSKDAPINITINGKTETRWFDAIIDPLHDEAGSIIGQLVTMIETSEQVQTRKKIEESEAGHKELANAMPQLVWIADNSGKVLYYNDRLTEFAGAYKDESGQWHWEGLIHPEDLDHTGRAWNNALEQGGIYQAEHRIQMKNGEYRWFLSRGIPQKQLDGTINKWFGTATDIHDQKMAEAKLRESETYFRQLFDTIPSIIWTTDPDGSCTYLNKSWYNYTGQSKKEAEGFGWLDVTHPDDKDESARIFLDANAKRESFSILYRLRHKSGEYRWAIDSGSPKFASDGSFEGMIGTVIDIHDRKMAEQSLVKATADLELATVSAQVGTWSLEVQTGILQWSRLHKKMWGFDESRDDLVYHDWHSVILPGDKEIAFAEVEKARLNHSQYEAIYRIQRADDGVIRWMRSTGQYFYDEADQPVLLTGVSIDITEQKAAEKLIKESEERFRTLAETLPQLIWMTNGKGEQEYVSSRWKEYTGIDPVDEVSWHKIIHPDDAKDINEAWTTSMRTGKLYRIEVRLKLKDGDYRWHFAQGEPIYNERKEIIKWIGAFTDIHDQKTISEKLEKLVIERTKELERSNMDLQQFAHVASHDLKEPVRKIKIFANRLDTEYRDVLDDRGKLYLDKVQIASDRMYAMIDGVLNYSSINTNQQQPEKIDLNHVIKNIENDLEILIQQKEAVLEYNELPVLTGASVLMYQLFYNLINNSLKFSKPGIAPKIVISSNTITKDGHVYLQIAVADNGIGFEPRHAELIFQTFTRLNPRDTHDGTGLGLSLCKKIVERHGGQISAMSQVGEGATFLIQFPLNESDKHI